MKEVVYQLPKFFLNDWLPSIVLLVLITLYNKEQRKEKDFFFLSFIYLFIFGCERERA